MYNIIKLIIILFFLSSSVQSIALEYQIEKKLLEGFSIPGHETITSMAIDCLIRFNKKEPKDCLKSTKTIGLLTSTTLVEVPSIPKLNAQELLDASSFPDDPTRVSDGLVKGIKSFVNNENKCDIRSLLPPFRKQNFHHDITGGLFCNSHFGVLQFWHAMASEPQPIIKDGKRVFVKNKEVVGDQESYETTMAKVLAWAKLTYLISADGKYEVLNERYCDYFETKMDDAKSVEMAKAFRPNDVVLNNPPLYLCQEKAEYQPYKVRWIFKQLCSGIVGGNCDIYGGENNYRGWQIAALGSLLHMIQDSYSQSHVVRETDNTVDLSFSARVDCSPIKGFLSYSKQDSDKHNEADVFPLHISENCFRDSADKVDDIVTASAKAIWYVQQHGNKNEDDFLNYLKSSVFKSPYKQGQLGPRAEAGKYFKKK